MKHEKIIAENPSYYTESECPSCNELNRIGDEASRYVRCRSCNTLYDRHFNKVTNDQYNAKDKLPRTFIRIGQRFKYEHEYYTVLARIVYVSRYHEHTVDDGNESYPSRKDNFTTWICRNEKGNEIFIGESKEGYTIGQKLTANVDEEFNISDCAYPFAKFALQEDHPGVQVEEYGTNTVKFFEGESLELYQQGKTYDFAAYTYEGNFYSYEEGEGWKEVYVEKKISKDAMYRYFNEAYGLPTYIKRSKGYSFIAGSVLASSLILLFIFALSFASDGELLVEGKFDTRKVVDAEEPLESEWFTLEELQTTHLIEWQAKFERVNSALFVVMEIVDEKGNVINGFQSSFWDEEGTDSDGHWHESDAEDSEYFRLDQPGKYKLRFYLEKESIGVLSSSDAIVSYKIKKDVLLSRYFLISASMLFILSIVMFASHTWRRSYILAAYKS